MSTSNKFTITEVRQGLNQIRKMWEEHTPFTPVNASRILIRDMSATEFAFKLLCENKQKRANSKG